MPSPPARTLLAPLCLLLLTAVAPGCKHETVGPSVENLVVGECYKPFFRAAATANLDDLRATLSKATLTHFERDIFRPGAVVESWKDFARVYSDMKISQFIKDVNVEGDRATVKDPVGGTFRCVHEGGSWKADFSDY